MTQATFRYPNVPAVGKTDTSRAAAEQLTAPRTLRHRVLKAVVNCANWSKCDNGITADQIAFVLGEDILSVRPRVTELNRLGLIRDTGLRRPNRSGRKAIVWKAA